MRRTLQRTLTAAALVLLAACGPKLPTTGTPSAFDGKWSGTAKGDRAECYAFIVNADVKFGHLKGEILDGSKIGDIWGKIGPDGTLDGDIGIAGVRDASAEVTLDSAAGTGQGSYTSSQCNGTISLTRN